MPLVDIDTTLLEETDRSKPPVPQAATKGGRPQRARMELAMPPGITAEALTCAGLWRARAQSEELCTENESAALLNVTSDQN